MKPTVVITGAGSGVGRAVALAMAKAGWNIALVGRREEHLLATAQLSGAGVAHALVCVCDIAQPDSVAHMARLVHAKFGTVSVLVNAAGTNTPQRSLEVLDFAKYREIVETNLTGAYLCVQAFLPEMRQNKSGTIINIVSDAAKAASAKAGPAYVVSKFGQLGLTQSINAEERANGVRACAILPGDIDTPLLDKRPSPPPAEARLNMLQAEDVAACVLFAVQLPPRAIIEELLVRPR